MPGLFQRSHPLLGCVPSLKYSLKTLAMIEVQNLTKSFGDKTVLDNISVKFETGKTNLIIGQSRSGKTVLMKNLVGLLRTYQRKGTYDGRDFVQMSRRRRGDDVTRDGYDFPERSPLRLAQCAGERDVPLSICLSNHELQGTCEESTGMSRPCQPDRCPAEIPWRNRVVCRNVLP